MEAISHQAFVVAQNSKEITKGRSLLCAVGDSKAARCTDCITTCRIALKIARKVAKAIDEEHSDCVEAWAFTFVPVALFLPIKFLFSQKPLVTQFSELLDLLRNIDRCRLGFLLICGGWGRLALYLRYPLIDSFLRSIHSPPIKHRAMLHSIFIFKLKLSAITARTE